MAKVIGVRFRNTGKSYYFDPDGKDISVGTDVIVETAQGMELGRVTMAVKDVPEEQIVSPLKKVLRVATRADERKAEENAEKEARALGIAEEKAAAHVPLSMAVLSADLEPAEIAHLTELLGKPEPMDGPGREKALADYIERIREEQRSNDLMAVLENKRNKKGYGG